MKITIVHGWFLPVPPLRGGAAESHWYHLGEQLVRRGHEVAHISRTWPGLPREDEIGGAQHLRVPGNDLPRSRLGILLRDFAYTVQVLQRLPPADILVINTITLPVFARSRRWGAVWVVAGRMPKGQTRFYGHAARIQAPSAAVAEAIARERGSREKICVLPYSLPRPTGWTDESQEEKKRERVVLFVGRIHPEKGVHLLVEAWKGLAEKTKRNWRLVLVGPWEDSVGGGGEAYYRRLDEESSGCGFPIEWKGPVYNPKALQDLYRTASLFVYPSLAERGESFGVAPLEAMAQGCPVLLSELACFRDYLKEGENGWTFDHRAADSSGKLGEKLQALLRDEAGLAAAGERASQTACSFFPEALAPRYLESFAEVIAEVRSGRRG
ncbi:glycosyltransferase family 4 protein [Verrucomicrobium sp. 3C]|uniref:glycosyltransferase family 4 protein n=1 Tax=Verrucomicrobium sp. 3C TaxID=1134055 RepID=UPI000364FCAD|nr:glycosyltransferase family 4 protein [Verrucomicrobium sp. 3C]